MTPPRDPKRSSLRARAALALAATLLALLAAELVLRFLAPQWRVHRTGMYTFDADRGYRLKPDLHLVGTYGSTNVSTIITSSLGYRDEELNTEAPLLVLALGDSHTFGQGVDQREDYPAVLEHLLRERSGRPVEVVNAGVPAYGWLEASFVLAEFLSHARPHVVLLQASWNDINDNGAGIPKYMLDGRGHLLLYAGKIRPGGYGPWGMKTEAMGAWQYYALQHSHLATLVLGQWQAHLYRRHQARLDAAIEAHKWAVSEDALRAMRQACADVQAHLLVVMHPGARPEALAKRAPMTAQVLALCTALGIDVVDLGPALLAQGDPARLFLAGDEHFNAGGYHWMAEQLVPPVLTAAQRARPAAPR